MTTPLDLNAFGRALRDAGPIYGTEAVEAWAAEAVAEVERLRAALDQTAHVLALDEGGWSIEHLVWCRPQMTRCDFHQAAQKAAKAWHYQPRPAGRYAVSLAPDGALVIGERINGSGATA